MSAESPATPRDTFSKPFGAHYVKYKNYFFLPPSASCLPSLPSLPSLPLSFFKSVFKKNIFAWTALFMDWSPLINQVENPPI